MYESALKSQSECEALSAIPLPLFLRANEKKKKAVYQLRVRRKTRNPLVLPS